MPSPAWSRASARESGDSDQIVVRVSETALSALLTARASSFRRLPCRHAIDPTR